MVRSAAGEPFVGRLTEGARDPLPRGEQALVQQWVEPRRACERPIDGLEEADC
jgi:hypothetical protein